MKRYDGDLQMFVEEPRLLDMSKLLFLRWLVEQGMLEHLPASNPSGELAIFYTSRNDGCGRD